jgi:hypothetical protein
MSYHHKAIVALIAFVVLGLATPAAKADNFSFTGNLSSNDQILLFNFGVGSSSQVTLRTYSYAGGVNAAGQIIARGGFDPILALFNADTGALIDQNDDGGANVPPDAVTGFRFDTFFQATLNPGNYTVSITQFPNFAIGPNLSNGFSFQGQGNFLGGFPDQDGRDSHWAFDVLGANTAVQVPSSIPEPTTMLLFSTGLVGVAMKARQRRKE